jgi:RNA polymerase sigma factor (TIGR02999 family)
MSSSGETTEVTLLLKRWREGDEGAYDQVVDSVYKRLLAIASSLASHDRHNINPAALVNEAYMRLRQLQRMEWKSRHHFFAFAATQMRRILIEHARRRLAGKREGQWERVPLTAQLAWTELPEPAILDLDAALELLAKSDSELVRLVELRYLMGYSVAELGELMHLSEATVDRRLRFARAWLNARLSGAGE